MLGTLVLSAMLLVLEKMLRLFDFVATEGGPVSVVWRMLANLIPEYLSLGIPIGLMLGILLAFRRLATSSELAVLRGVGMSLGRDRKEVVDGKSGAVSVSHWCRRGNKKKK